MDCGISEGMSSRGRFATAADFTSVARTHMYAYAAKVWDLCIVQGPFSVAPCQTLANIPIRDVFVAVRQAAANGAAAAEAASPGLQYSRMLKQEQDAAFQQSLDQDRAKEAAAAKAAAVRSTYRRRSLVKPASSERLNCSPNGARTRFTRLVRATHYLALARDPAQSHRLCLPPPRRLRSLPRSLPVCWWVRRPLCLTHRHAHRLSHCVSHTAFLTVSPAVSHTPPSNSPHDPMILRVDLVGSHGSWKRPCLQTAHMTI
jgi:hypothetical protein